MGSLVLLIAGRANVQRDGVTETSMSGVRAKPAQEKLASPPVPGYKSENNAKTGDLKLSGM